MSGISLTEMKVVRSILPHAAEVAQ